MPGSRHFEYKEGVLYCASMIWSVLLKEKSVCVCVFMCVCGFCVIFSPCVFAADCICCKLAAVSTNEETAHKDTC